MEGGGFSREYLRNNLAALAVCAPSLRERLCEGVESAHVRLHDSSSGHVTASLVKGPPLYLHSAADPVKEAEEAVHAGLPETAQVILCLGVGLGYYLAALLGKANPCQPVIAYERDPWLLRLALTRFDFSRDLLAGRVRFLLGTDVSTAPASLQAPPFLWLHPVLGPLYTEEQAYLSAWPRTESRRALVVSGGLLVQDLIEALRDRGVSVLTWNPMAVSQKETLHQIRTFDPHLIVAVNFLQGLPEICETLGIPLLIWEIDPTIERLPRHRSPLSSTHIFTYRKSRVPHFRRAGFGFVEYLPLATNPRRRHPIALSADEQQQYGARVSFVGSSMVDQSTALHGLYRELTTHLAGRSEANGLSTAPPPPHRSHLHAKEPDPDAQNHGNAGTDNFYADLWDLALAHQRGHPDSYVVDEVLAAHGLGQPEALQVHDGSGRLVDLAFCIAEEAASERRRRILNSLAREGLTVWGDTHWRHVLAPAIQYRGAAGHSNDLTKIYSGSQVNLDINRIYQKDIVTMRIFDILACKAFVLADASDALGELFLLDQEVVAYASEAALPALVEHFLQNERERRQVAEAGYEKVITEHTIKRRLEHMLQCL